MHYEDDKYYHIYNRGAHQSLIFFSPENYRYCLRLLQKYKLKYRVAIVAYCLMPNHYHLVLRQSPEGSISNFLRTVFNAYAQAVNRRSGKSGTLFQGRPKARIIDSDAYALQVVRYIHLNPVIAKIVTAPESWQFSDYQAWIGATSSSLTDLSLRNAYFRDQKEYRDFVEAYKEESDTKIILKCIFEE